MLISKNHIHNFKKWDNFLTSLGYKNYTECLNAKDFGIPQNRNRCFMVSVLGDYNYTFPIKQKLNIKLKDMLEETVDEKYYLTPKQIVDIQGWKAYEKPLEQLEKIDKKQVSPTITTRSGAYAAGMILVKDDIKLKQHLCEKLIKDGVVKEYDVVKHSYTTSIMEGKKKCIETNDTMITLTTRCDCVGVVARDKKDGFVENKYLLDDLRIRKLTPKETTRLMGFEDSDYDAMKQDLSDMTIYHCCGDSIVVNVLENIFKQMKEQ